MVTEQDVRAFLGELFADSFEAVGGDPVALDGDFDLLMEGVIDSLGILEMMPALEERFGVELDFEELPAEDLTRLGPLSRFVATQASGGAAGGS